ncbi:MAG: hypothetical protein JNK72_10160 [Myxococcales bacterium]|nr:hypothetical protein [Myxococcales bacterium]
MTTGKKKKETVPPGSKPSREQRTSGAFLGTPDGEPRKVRQASVHNWVELVYKAFGRELPTKAKEVALLVVREARFSGGGTAADVANNEESAGYGGEGGAISPTTRSADRFETKYGKNKKGKVVALGTTPTVTFNDLVYCVWTDEDAAKLQRAEVYRCTVDPGGNEESTSGTPYQLEGHHYKAYPRQHQGKGEGLSMYTSAIGKIVLAREATKKVQIFTNIESAQVPAHGSNSLRQWLFCNEEANDTIHLHWSDDYEEGHLVKRWSTGCTVLMHAQASEHYKRLRSRWQAAPNKQEIPYLVVSSKYVRTYDEWIENLRLAGGGTPEPKSVIKVDKLEVAPGISHEKRYVPSFVTKGFLEQVEAKAKESTAAQAANLREAAARICINTLRI